MSSPLPAAIKKKCQGCLGCVADARAFLALLPAAMEGRENLARDLDAMEEDARRVLGEQQQQQEQR